MEIAELTFKGRMWAWANNCEDEGFVEERFDRFFAFFEWFIDYPQAVVTHVHKQSSDHCLLLLNTNPNVVQTKKRFHVDNRALKKEDTLMESQSLGQTATGTSNVPGYSQDPRM